DPWGREADRTHRGAERPQSAARLRGGSAFRWPARPGPSANRGSDTDRRRHQRRAERAEAPAWGLRAGDRQVDGGDDCARGRTARGSGETPPPPLIPWERSSPGRTLQSSTRVTEGTAKHGVTETHGEAVRIGVGRNN